MTCVLCAGSEIYGAVGSLAHFKVEVESLDTSSRESQGWLTGYNIRHNYSSPWRLSEAIGGHEYLAKALREYAAKTSAALQKTYENPTVSIDCKCQKSRDSGLPKLYGFIFEHFL